MPDPEGYARQMSRTISADKGNIRYGTRSPSYDESRSTSVGDSLYRGAAREYRKYRGVGRALYRGFFRNGSR